MNAPRKYYWLKLRRDFFKRHDMQIIESMPNGKDYILFYLKLLVESIDHEGNLRFSDNIPYNDQMLASITNTNIDIVRSAVKLFTELGMMDCMDDGTLYMNQVASMMGTETEWAEKKRLYRDKPKTIEGQKRTLSDKSIELELEIELEKEIIQDTQPARDNPEPRTPKKRFGHYKNVRLTEAEYHKLGDDFPNATEAIEYLSEYREMKGYKAKSDYLAIRKWVFVALTEQRQRVGGRQVDTADEIKFQKMMADLRAGTL